MFLTDDIPIIYNAPTELDHIELYFIHDLHYGSSEFNSKKWEALKKRMQDNPFARIMWVGDLMENAIPNSKSDMFSQTATPHEQKEWVTNQLQDLANKTIVVVSGNHENNRSTKAAGLYPLYDACSFAGLSKCYRDTFAIVDIGVGLREDKKRQIRYVGQIQHKSRDIKACSSADFTDGIDFFVSGHDHEPKDKPRAKLVYDAKNKNVYKRNIETLNCGAFMQIGGYGAKAGYRPQSDKIYTLTLLGGGRGIETKGFYL